MSDLRENLTTIVCLLALTVIVIVLVSPPGMLFMEGVTFLDTNPNRSSETTTFVETTMDFGDSAALSKFPYTVGEWWGDDYPDNNIPEKLGADVMILRSYQTNWSYFSLIFLILESSNTSSFHPPEVCYPMSGWTIENETKDVIDVSDAPWIGAYSFFDGRLPVNKLVVHREDESGTILERQSIFYFYVKDMQWSVNDGISMVRVSAPIPLEGDATGMEDIAKEFLGETMPLLFEFRAAEPVIGMLIVNELGPALGGGAIALVIGAPIAIITYERRRKKEV